MKKYFPYVDNNYNKQDEVKDVLTIVTNMYSKEPDNENIEKTQQIIRKYDHEQDESLEREFLLESIKKNFQNELLVFFDKFIEHFETFLTSLGFKNYADITESKKFCLFKANVYSDLNKFRLSFVGENIENSVLEICLKNSFQTHGFH